MAPILIHVDLGQRRLIPIRTFININPRSFDDAETGQTLKFEPLPRIILANTDLENLYNDLRIREVLCNVLFVYNEDEFNSVVLPPINKDPKNECKVALNSEHWRAQLIISWRDIESLRLGLMEYQQSYNHSVLVNKHQRNVLPYSIKVLVTDKL